MGLSSDQVCEPLEQKLVSVDWKGYSEPLILKILGIHASFNSKTHDPAVALIDGDEILFAAEEERYLRYKTSSGRFPEYALDNCLRYTGCNIRDIDYVAVDGETSPNLSSKISRYITDLYGSCPPVLLVNHAKSHILGAHFFSPFNPDLIISIDGSGDRLSSVIYTFENGIRKLVHASPEENSLGNYYTALTNYLGFKSIEGEYKVMGMAAYSTPPKGLLQKYIYFDKLRGTVVASKELLDGSHYSSIYEPVYNLEKLKNLFGAEPRGKAPITDRHYNMAGEVQFAFEEAYINYILHYCEFFSAKNIVITGGCALNILANYKLSQRAIGLNIFAFPLASDRGLALGSAATIYYEHSQNYFKSKKILKTLGLGKCYSETETFNALNNSGLKYSKFNEMSEVYTFVAKSIYLGMVIGWHQGRSEYGPRALGFRSILADATRKGIKDLINKKIKFREKYRPFAPAMLEEDFSKLGVSEKISPYMSEAFDVSKHKQVFGETMHEDGTARVQTVDNQTSPYLYSLLLKLKRYYDTPVVINTSFNLAGEPIVESPTDAIRTFVSSGLDLLVIGNFIVTK